MGKQKHLILFLIILNVLNFRLRKGIVRAIIYRIYIKHGVFLVLKEIGIDRKLNISIDRIYLKHRSRLQVIISSFTISVNFRSVFLFKWRSTLIKRIGCELLDVLFRFPDKAGIQGRINGDPVASERLSFVPRLIRRFQRNTFSRIDRLVYSIRISYVKIKYPKRNIRAEMEVMNFEKEGSVIKGFGLLKALNYTINIPLRFTLFENYRRLEILNFAPVCIKHKDVVLAETNSIDLSFTKNGSNQFYVSSKVTNLFMDHSILSTEPLHVTQINVNATINILSDSIELDRNSTFLFNGIPVLIEFSYNFVESHYLKTSFIIVIDGRSFFKSYPLFYTKSLNNVEATGQLVLQVIYVHNLKDVTEGYFRTKIIKDDLHIGNLNDPAICALTGDFLHTAVKNGAVLRKIQIGDGNPDYVSMQHIPQTLRELIIICEDPNFYEHKGIDVYAIQLAILHNLNQQKFSRGASTITMQLVRNLFLGHHKNISRKLEEFIIAWLLEEYVPLKKERILEIYLNIIEFGDNVYGVSEAADYYFGKAVGELSLLEQLVLSYIIPRPDFFLEALLSQSEQLKQRLKNHIQCYAKLLLERKELGEKEMANMPDTIVFKPAFGCLRLY